MDSKDQFYGAPLDDSSNWAFSAWGPGEPSYTSDGIDETAAAIYKYQGNWILNDVPVDMLSAAPDYKGIIGYICEYEDNAEASSYEQQTVSGSNGNASGSYTVRGLNGTANNVHIPREFYFSSGAGAWGTSLYMNEDWSFTGDFHDSNMGETGPGYPGGTCYISNFSGTFSTPEMVTDTCARLELRSLSFTPSEDEKNISNDILYIGATPYGVYGGEEFYLYFPGQPYDLIPEDCRIWMSMYLENKNPDVIPDGMYVLYNISEGDAFVARD